MKLQSRRDDMEPHINVTSLIDVLFLLLMFFMLTTTFVKDAELKIQLPRASITPNDKASQGLEVAVDARGRYFINGRELINTSPEILKEGIRKMAQGKAEQPFIVRADARAQHQAVVTLLDVASQLGYGDIVIETINQNQTAP
jgi:biopolymer transport protein ExbD